MGQDAGFPRTQNGENGENGDRARHGLAPVNLDFPAKPRRGDGIQPGVKPREPRFKHVIQAPKGAAEIGENGERARHGLTGDRKFSRLGDFMPRVGFPRSPQDTRKTQDQDTPIPAVLGKTRTDYKAGYGVSGIEGAIIPRMGEGNGLREISAAPFGA